MVFSSELVFARRTQQKTQYGTDQMENKKTTNGPDNVKKFVKCTFSDGKLSQCPIFLKFSGKCYQVREIEMRGVLCYVVPFWQNSIWDDPADA